MNVEAEACWVPVAVADDILNGMVTPAKLPMGTIAVWRSSSGRIYANKDRCPHRGMRLSHGFVRGETLSCIYHGWRFGGDGACQKIPAHPDVVPPKTINCGPLPVTEISGVVWSAAQQPAEPPAGFDNHHALRSLVISASPEAVILASGGTTTDAALKAELAGHNVLLLLNTIGQNEVFVIIIVADGLSDQDKKTVSVSAEALRRKAEALGETA